MMSWLSKGSLCRCMDVPFNTMKYVHFAFPTLGCCDFPRHSHGENSIGSKCPSLVTPRPLSHVVSPQCNSRFQTACSRLPKDSSIGCRSSKKRNSKQLLGRTIFIWNWHLNWKTNNMAGWAQRLILNISLGFWLKGMPLRFEVFKGNNILAQHKPNLELLQQLGKLFILILNHFNLMRNRTMPTITPY